MLLDGLSRFRDYKIVPEVPGRAGLLFGYRLVFNKKRTIDNSGKANVERREGSDVWGVLYTIPDGDLHTLDEGEGGYHREQLSVGLPDNTNTDAWVYIATRPTHDAGLRPYTWYKRFLVEGAREHSLPPEYIAELKRIEAVQSLTLPSFWNLSAK